MNFVQCMGGWCGQREKCSHYVAPTNPGFAPAERLCGKTEEPELIRQHDEKVAA